MPSIPELTPPWLGWVLFGVVLVVWALASWQKSKLDATQARKAEAETLQIQLSMIADMSASFESQLEAISRVLRDDAELRMTDRVDHSKLESFGGLMGNSLREHANAYDAARKELPSVLASMSNVQRRRTELERKVAMGIQYDVADLDSLRKALHGGVDQLGELVTRVLDAPRIFVSDEEPPFSRNGDLWIQPQPDSEV